MLTLQAIHNILRWIVLLFAALTIFTTITGLGGKKEFTHGDKRTALYLLISVDLQLVIGLVLYYLHGYFSNFSGGKMADVMKDPIARFWTVEHTSGMLLAIILVHIGYAGTKGARPHIAKFRRLFWCTLIAVVLMLASIPWPSRAPGIARPWLPGVYGS